MRSDHIKPIITLRSNKIKRVFMYFKNTVQFMTKWRLVVLINLSSFREIPNYGWVKQMMFTLLPQAKMVILISQSKSRSRSMEMVDIQEFYSVFHQFRQAKSAYGDSILSSSQFLYCSRCLKI